MIYPTDGGSAVPTPRYRSPKFLKDFAERVSWTAVQAALGLVVVESFDLPLWSVPIAASALAAVKGYVAKKIGNKDSASTVPSV
jgi:hypothetical protein